MLFFIFSFLTLSAGSTTKVCICEGSCPESCSDASKIVVTSSTNINEEISKIKTSSMDVLFTTTTSAFSFSLSTFDDVNVSFKPISTLATLKIDVTTESTAMASFSNLAITFSGASDQTILKAKSLTFKGSSVRISSLSDKIEVGQLDSDYSSIQNFEEITFTANSGLKAPLLKLDMTSSYDSSFIVMQSQVIVQQNANQIIIKFEDENQKTAYISTTSATQKATVSKSGSTSISSLTLDGFSNISFDASSWATTDYVLVTNTKNNVVVTSQGNLLPLSINVGSKNATIVASKSGTQVTGNLTADFVIFQTTFTTSRSDIECLSQIAAEIIIDSSLIDLTVATLKSNGGYFYREYPFIFSIGKSGVSTVNVKKTIGSDYYSYSDLRFKLEFNKYLQDNEYTGLLNKNTTLLTWNGPRIYSDPSIIFLTTDTFIHGYHTDDSIISVKRVSSSTGSVNLSFYASSPNNLPLRLCVGSCLVESMPKITKEEISQLTNKYLVPGIKNFELLIQTPLDAISFTGLTSAQTDMNIHLRGTSYLNDGISEIDFGGTSTNSHIVNLTLEELTLGGDLYLNIQNVTILQCEGRKDTKLHFSDVVNLTADENFIPELLPNVTGSITNFTYLMNFFDTVTFNDNEFVFEDRESNLLSQKLNYSAVKNFHLMYDVGVRYTYTGTNLYLIANTTKETPAISVLFSLYEYSYMKRAQLIFANWSKSTESRVGKISFYHSTLSVNIVLTEPYLPKNFEVFGTGELSYITKYADSLELCAYGTATSDCGSISNKVAFANLSTYLTTRDEDNITIYVFGGSSSNPLPLKLSTINKKQVHVIGDHKTQQYLRFESTETETDTRYSSANFTNITITHSGSSPTFTFGELQFNNAPLQGFDDVSLKVDDFYTTYEILSQFKNVFVIDNLVVSGNLVDKECTINFQADENSEDLKATISEDATIIMGNGYAKIGKMKFTINKSVNFDIILSIPNRGTTITLQCESGAGTPQIPYVRFMQADSINLKFTGTWPVGTLSDTFLVSIGKADNIKIYLDSENVPLQCEYISGNFEFIALKESVGITGAVRINPAYNSKSVFSYDASKISKGKITLKGGLFFDSNLELSLLQPNLEVVIPTAHKNDTTRSSTPDLDFIFYIDATGSSLASVNLLNGVEFSSSFTVDLNISGSLDDAAVKKILDEEIVLLKVDSKILDTVNKFGFSFKTAPKIHGFSEKIFELKNDVENERVVFKNIISPYTIPFELCYGSTFTECEIKLDNSTYEKFYEKLPSGPTILRFEISSDPGNKVLNFDVDRFSQINVTIQNPTFGYSNYAAKCKFGNNRLAYLEVDGINISSDEPFKIESVYLNNQGVFLPGTDLNGISNLKIDFESYSYDLFQKFYNSLTIECNKDYTYNITFNLEGWTLKGTSYSKTFEDTFYSSDFPKLTFLMNGNKRPIFSAQKGISRIVDAHIIAHQKSFLIGPNWESVLEPQVNIELLADLDDIRVETESFPFRPFKNTLMKANYVQFSKDLLPVTIEKPLTLHDEQYMISFDDILDEEKEHVYINDLILERNSSLGFEDYKYDLYGIPSQIKRVVVKDGATASISAAEIMEYLQIEGDAVFSDDDYFEIDEGVVKFIWELNKMPKLVYNNKIEYAPKGVEIIFNESSISGKENDYNTFLYQKAYSLVEGVEAKYCQDWIKNIKFTSTVSYFSTDPVYEVTCNNGNLQLIGRKLIPAGPTQPHTPTTTTSSSTSTSTAPITSTSTSSSSYTPITITAEPTTSSTDDQGQDSGSSPGKIAGITIGVVLLAVAAVVVLVITILYMRKRKQAEAQLNNEPLAEYNQGFDGNVKSMDDLDL
ncbi:hypothetical protein TRFO_27310 [Tritrichomonas foetus]|uniref:Uncharacterized protein n=1 Tax=Tritrichomonas foetus TaxID=1144522 RepID=A0A1J4K2C9_9EUKA|nr:hypothetical protein TRFO_27310 [Tritrichomonas foetus]|eukprot:OHT05122.1 hypothetical protein TRFO_27310 [Tritrichomonas foetus]